MHFLFFFFFVSGSNGEAQAWLDSCDPKNIFKSKISEELTHRLTESWYVSNNKMAVLNFTVDNSNSSIGLFLTFSHC